jgi:glucokinase
MEFKMKIGIDIGGSHIGIGIVDNFGKIIEKREIRILKENKKNIEKFVEDYLVENIKELILKYKIELIGISSAGVIKDGIILNSPNLGFSNYNIVKNIKSKINTNIPIHIKNDAICAAIAEKEYGSIKNIKDALFLSLGTGIGGAVFVNNKLLKSDDVSFFEFGHIILKENGIECNCGKKGCFEKYASMKVLKNNLRKNLNLNQTTSGKELINIINENPNNEIIMNTINEYIENLSEGILILLDRFKIYSISLGGSFVYYQDILLKKLEDKLFEKIHRKINLKIAVLENDAGIVGATLTKK